LLVSDDVQKYIIRIRCNIVI